MLLTCGPLPTATKKGKEKINIAISGNFVVMGGNEKEVKEKGGHVADMLGGKGYVGKRNGRVMYQGKATTFERLNEAIDLIRGKE